MPLEEQYQRFRRDIDPLILEKGLPVEEVKFMIGEAVHEALRDKDAQNEFAVLAQKLSGERPSRAVVTEDYGSNLVDNLRTKQKRSGSTKMAYAMYFTLHAKSDPLHPQFAQALKKLDQRLLGLTNGFSSVFKWAPSVDTHETDTSWVRFVEKHERFKGIEVIREGELGNADFNISDIAPRKPEHACPIALGQGYRFQVTSTWQGTGLAFQVVNGKIYPIRNNAASFSFQVDHKLTVNFPALDEGKPNHLVESGPAGLSKFVFLTVAAPHADIMLAATDDFNVATEIGMNTLNFLSKLIAERSANFDLLSTHVLFVAE